MVKVGIPVEITGLYQSIHSFLKWGYVYLLLILSFII